ncbi:MAG TPA: DUF1629 domain-containing protein [Longimicrobium sp.]|nr:DUF1629 domain-containing protein [Longimicrobium sp.]
MKHWIWTGYAPGAGHAFAEDQEGLTQPQLEAILFGRPIAEPLPETRVTKLSAGKLPDVMGSAFYALLVTDAVRAVLEEHAGKVVQFLPAKVKGKRAAYWALNATGQAKAMDRAKSKFKAWSDGEGIESVRHLALKVPASAPALFHLAEIPQVLVVSDALKEALEAASKSPGDFESPGEWRLGFFEDEV